MSHHITFARLGVSTFCRNDLDISLGSRNPLEVLQGLFDIAQVEQIARVSRHGIPDPGPATAVLGETDVADAAWYQGQAERPLVQVLGLGQYTSGDEASGNDRILDAFHTQVDTGSSQTAA